MKVRPRISACIPCYEAADTLRSAAGSIRTQTVLVDELLVIDDGSSDCSAAVGRSVAERFIRFESNRGRGAVRAHAVEELGSDFILFCDAAIALPRNFVELALRHMEGGSVAAVFGAVVESGSSTIARWSSRHLYKTEQTRVLDRRALLATGAVLVRRSAVMQVGNFCSDLHAGEDAEVGRRLLAAGFEVIFDPALKLRCLRQETVRELLRRYTRWNCAPNQCPSYREYGKLVRYGWDGMVRQDLHRFDLACALISFISPHYLFWSRWLALQMKAGEKGAR